VFDLKKVDAHHVEAVDDGIVVVFGAPALAPRAKAPAATAEGMVNALNRVGPVTCRATDTGTRLEIRTAVKADFTVVDSSDPAKVIVEIANAQVSDKDAQTIDLASQGLDVVKVAVFPYTKGDARLVRIVAQLRQPVSFRTLGENGRIVVEFDKAAAVAPVAPAPAAAAPAAAPQATVEAAPARAAAATPPPAPAAPAVPASATATTQFTGRRLSLDFKDAEVNDILRLISEVSGLNFVAGPEVKGTVSIKLADVPWDQALDLILKTNVPQLEQVRESENIVRITTADKLMDEEQRHRRVEEDKKKTADAQKALEPVFQKTFAISYIESGKMTEFVAKLDKFKSTQGIIQFDDRTKQIIVWDTAAKLKELEQVIITWDAPTPAVLVEARIVEVESGFGQSIGVQWNAKGIKDAAHGNGTKYEFPNSVSIGGKQTAADSNDPTAGPTNYLVNLPSSIATGGVGFSLGHIANTLSLDMRLSAGENMNKVKILSNPKVLVIQNEQAIINLGSQLPIPKTDAEGNRTVEWKDVGIKLDVKPQITNDKRVFMAISIEKSSQGGNVQTTEGSMFSINTSRAQSKVLIADGETTVIGGIFIEENSGNSDSIPGLSKIPILGWLFKNKTTSSTKRELMIFITPKIVVM
jgi:type IV pilus assembly protein PilQ